MVETVMLVTVNQLNQQINNFNQLDNQVDEFCITHFNSLKLANRNRFMQVFSEIVISPTCVKALLKIHTYICLQPSQYKSVFLR